MTTGSSIADKSDGFPRPGLSGVLPVGWRDTASRNAVGADVARRMVEELTGAEDEAVRVVVLGADQTPFCSGWDVRDLTGLDTSSREDVAGYFEVGRDLLSAVEDCPVPVVAAVSGAALGFGCSLLAHADLVLAEEEAVFGLPEISRGFPPATVMPELLEVMGSREVGAWALTGAKHDAVRAAATGLVHRITPAGELSHLLADVLADMTQTDSMVLRKTKALLRGQRSLPLPQRRADGVTAAVDHFCK